MATRKKILPAACALLLCAAPALGAGPVECPDTTAAGRTLDLPYGRTLPRSLSTGGAATLGGEELSKYPTNDLRNSLTGLLPGLVVTENDGSPGLFYGAESSRTSLSLRGLAPVYVIDGMPCYITQLQLDPEEIASVTLVKDVADKALFGSRAANGVLHITTRRGLASGRSVRVGFEGGLSSVDRFPEWVGGVDYARLQNQARINSGYMPLYSNPTIEGFARGDACDLRTPSVDYRRLMFAQTRPFYRASVAVDGGSERLRYSAHVGYAGEGDIYAAGSKADFNRLTVRSFLQAAITRDLSIDFGFSGGLTFRRSPCYGAGFSADEAFGAALSEANTVPAVAFPLIVAHDEQSGNSVYGVSSVYKNNPYASLTENGFYTDRGRSGVVNARIAYDLGALVRGLKFESYAGLNLFDMTRIGKNPDYTAVIYDTATGQSVKSTHEGTQVADKSGMGRWNHQGLFLYEKLGYAYRSGGHSLDAAAVYYAESEERSGSAFRQRQQSLVVSADYRYRDKYLVQAVVDYAGSSSFGPGRRYGTFPSLGLGWVISEEPFLRGAKWIDHLKVRAQAGVMGYDALSQPDYPDSYYVKSKGINFGPYTTGYEWLGSTGNYQSYVNTISRIGNPALTWEKRKELTVGIDAVLLRGRLSVEADYFRTLRDGMLTDMNSTLPDALGLDGVAFYANYDRIRYTGWELSLGWRDRAGDFEYALGADLSSVRGKYVRYNENVGLDYQRVTGTRVGDYRGYVCIGKFASQEEIDASPRQLFDDRTEVGDLKYADLNGDGFVDDNDIRVVGNTAPKLHYAVRLNLRYRNFDLTVVGTGCAGFRTPLTNDYFWNGWGTDNYSAFVRAHIGGDYPHLAYVKQTNNFQDSDFWLRRGGWFKFQNVELGYNLRFRNAPAIKGLRIFLRGANLCTISGIEEVDPENIDAGVTAYPLYRTFTAGFKFTF